MAVPEFTSRQLDLELALLLWDLHGKLWSTIGEDRAALAFGFPKDRTALWEYLPEEIPVEEFPIRDDVLSLAAYVVNQRGYRGAALDIRKLGLLTYWIDDDLEDYWGGAAAAWPEFAGTGKTPHGEDNEPIDEGFAVGIHYRGIIKSLMALGAARHKVDQDEPLSLPEMALLVGFNERSVMSAASRGEFSTEMRDNRRWIAAKDALKWMLPRGYLPTKWDGASTAPTDATTETPASYEEMVFVPVSRDKTFFSPSCRMAGGYTIGPKGAETKVQDFYEALSLLTRMPTPRWRRPNEKGNWGIVTGVEWDRVTKQSIDDRLSELSRKGKGNEQ